MIVKEKRVTEVSSNIEAKSFHIGDQAIVMRTLSNLYDQPMLAVVREISCNAIDAHIDGGNPDKPFDLYISELEIAWRDYGIGMSHEFCEDVYFAYGKSTKRTSNDQTGYFGLGSKSPLGYTNVMFVDTWKDGIKNSYQVTFVEFKGPQYRHISSQPSTEPSGTKIYFKPKSRYDAQLFYNYAKSVFQYFKVKPNLYWEGQKRDIEQVKYTTKGTNFRLKENGESKLVMGNVAYDLNTSKWKDHLTPKEQAVLNRAKIDLFFKIGDLEITPTREEVQLTTGNVRKVRAILDNVIDEITKELKNELDGCKNIWEARLLYTKSRSYAKNLIEPEYKGTKFITSSNWNGKEYSEAIIDFSQEKWDPITVGEVTHKRNKLHTYRVYPNLRFILNDLNKGAVSRCKQEWNNTSDTIILVKDDATIKNRIIEICGFDDSYFEKASDLEATASSPSVKRGKTAEFCLFDRDYSSISYAWKAPTISPEDGGYYTNIYRYYGQNGDEIYKQDELREILYSLETLGHKIDLHGIRAHKSEKFLEEFDDWTNIYDFCKKVIDDAAKKKYLICSKNPTWLVNPRLFKTLKFENLETYYNEAKQVFNNTIKDTTMSDIKTLARNLRVDIPTFQIEDVVDKLNKEKNRYPLLNLADSQQNTQHAKKYIELVEQGKI